MPTAVKTYQREMHTTTGFFATWLPGDPIDIGDVGVFEGGRFRKMSSFQELKIKYSKVRGKSFQSVDYSSRRGTKIATSMSTEAATLGNAEITIHFSREGAFVFQALKMQSWELENRKAVSDKIVEAFHKKVWDKSWMWVESLHTADRATIVISEEKAAELVLTAKLNETLPSVSLVNPNVSLSVASFRGKMIRLIGSPNLHPLYSCLRLKVPRLLGKPSPKPVRGAKRAATDVDVSRPGIDELLES